MRNNPFFCYFDSPGPCVTKTVQLFQGWFAAREPVQPVFRVNGNIIESAKCFERDDLKDITEGCFATGWSFYLDCAHVMTASQHALVIEICVDDRVVGRNVYRCKLPRDLVGEKDLLAFIHVPKTGGTSVRRAFEDHQDFFELLPAYDDRGFFPMRDLESLSRAGYSGIDAVYGHFSFGFHRQFSRRTRYVSLIRNPFDTVLSFYFFARYEQKREALLNCRDIYEAIETVADPCFGNVITRMFAGLGWADVVTRSSFDAAIENIERDFEFIGILEDLPRSLSRIGEYLGLNLVHHRDNVTRSTAEQELLDIGEFRKFVAPHIQYDLALYEYVLEKFWGAGNQSTLIAKAAS